MKHFGLVGKKLSHSHSPLLHKIIYKHAHIEANYDLIELDDIHGINKIVNHYNGLNITIPYKESILETLSIQKETSLCAINTLHIQRENLIGHNTDVYGFYQLLERNKVNVLMDVCILGYGGAAQAVIEALIQYGFKEITIFSRSLDHLEKPNLTFKTYEEFTCNQTGIIINTTPIGMFPNTDLILPPDQLINFDCFIDLIYNPLVTPFLSIANQYHRKSINGIEMLVFQAIRAVEIWESCHINDQIRDEIFKEFIHAIT